MGYYITQSESSVSISARNVPAAFAALKAAAKARVDKNLGWGWCDPACILEAETFEEAMHAARWDVSNLPDTGEVIDLFFSGEKSADEVQPLLAIAPFVNNGSYIAMRGEDDYFWKWVFRDGKLYEVNGYIAYYDNEAVEVQ